MKTLAQYGFGPKDKIDTGIYEGILDGVILSPRYCKPERMEQTINDLRDTGKFLGIDPEFYATNYISHPTPNLGALEEWEYFRTHRRADLISGAAIPAMLRDTLSAQIKFGLEHLIAPNVFIQQADSIDTAIALNSLIATKSTANQLTDKTVYGTLAIHRDALLAGETFRTVLDGLTGIERPPDGYYIVVGSSELQSTGKYVRSDLSQPEVIAGWMYTNYVLSINGADVINGYCFLLSPILAICGAGASACGWTSGLRKFCIDRYLDRQGRGKAPNIRYLSNPLMSHVRQSDLDAYRALEPGVMNGLPFDKVYENREPTRTEEALQAWEALNAASEQAVPASGDLTTNLSAFRNQIGSARMMWERLRSAGFSNEVEPNLERLEAMEGGIDLFTEWAELA